MLARRTVLVVAALALLAAGCDRQEGVGPGEGTLVEGPRGAEDIVQHLVEAPAYPAPVTEDAELAELRNAAGTNRHQAFLADLDADGALDAALVRGALVQVADGVTLTVPDGASTASLEGDAVTAVAECAAPCEVIGPALVAPPGWLPGIGVEAGWELLVPAPEQ